MSKAEKENRINSLAVTFLERQQIKPNPLADQIIRAYKEGYHQAEKDLELTWEDVENIITISYKLDKEEEISGKYAKLMTHYQEVLKRYKDFKESKEK